MQPQEDNGFMIVADVMPFYQFDFGTVFLNIRIGMNEDLDNYEKDEIVWGINPYIRIPVQGDLRFGALITGNSESEYIEWKVAMSMLFSF